MSGILQGKVTGENRHLKYFGYLLSVVFLIASVAATLRHSSLTPWLFLITMYFLTGCLWTPILIKPFYLLFGRFIIKPKIEPGRDKSNSDKNGLNEDH